MRSISALRIAINNTNAKQYKCSLDMLGYILHYFNNGLVREKLELARVKYAKSYIIAVSFG